MRSAEDFDSKGFALGVVVSVRRKLEENSRHVRDEDCG